MPVPKRLCGRPLAGLISYKSPTTLLLARLFSFPLLFSLPDPARAGHWAYATTGTMTQTDSGTISYDGTSTSAAFEYEYDLSGADTPSTQYIGCPYGLPGGNGFDTTSNASNTFGFLGNPCSEATTASPVVTLTWTHDPGEDAASASPPKVVYLVIHALAEGSGAPMDAYLDDTSSYGGTATADNGLGSPPVDLSLDHTTGVDVISDGYRLIERDGSSGTITVTGPTLSASCSGVDFAAPDTDSTVLTRLVYTVTPIAVSLTAGSTGQTPTAGTPTGTGSGGGTGGSGPGGNPGGPGSGGPGSGGPGSGGPGSGGPGSGGPGGNPGGTGGGGTGTGTGTGTGAGGGPDGAGFGGSNTLPYFSGTGCPVNATAVAALGNVAHAQLTINGTLVEEYDDTALPSLTAGNPNVHYISKAGQSSVLMSGVFDSTSFPDPSQIGLMLTVTDTDYDTYTITLTGPAYNKAVVYGNQVEYGGSLDEGDLASRNAAASFGTGGAYSVAPPTVPLFNPQNIPQLPNSYCNSSANAIFNSLPTYTVFYIWTHGNSDMYAYFGDCFYGTPNGEALRQSDVATNVQRKTAAQPPYGFVFVDSCLTAKYGNMAASFGIQDGVSQDQAYLGFEDVVGDNLYAIGWTSSVLSLLQQGHTINDARNITNKSYGYPSSGGTSPQRVKEHIYGDLSTKTRGAYKSDEGTTPLFYVPPSP